MRIQRLQRWTALEEHKGHGIAKESEIREDSRKGGGGSGGGGKIDDERGA